MNLISYFKTAKCHPPTNKLSKFLTLPIGVLILGLNGLLLIGCEPANQVSSSQESTNQISHKDNATTLTTAANNNLNSLFVGCYTISQEEDAQIKISEQAGKLVMQMRESNPNQGVWDKAEPLETIALAQVPKYFSMDAQNVTGMVGRPDRMLVLAHIKSAYVNINPLLDSDYLVFIYKGANTIFKSDCTTTANTSNQVKASTAITNNVTLKPVDTIAVPQ